MRITSGIIEEHIWQMMSEPLPNYLGEASRSDTFEISGREVQQNLSLLHTKSTGGVVWHTTLRVITALSNKTHPLRLKLAGRAVVELGCGTGALALLANDVSARWIASDQRDLVRLARKNCGECKKVDICEFDWELHDWSVPVDSKGIVVGCDLIYNEYLINPLISAVKSVFDSTGISEAMIANQLRDSEVLSRALEQFCLNFQVEYLDNLGSEFTGYPVYLLRKVQS